MFLRIAVLTVLGLLLFGSTARADQMVIALADPGVDLSVSDGAIYVSSSGVAVTDDWVFPATSSLVLSPAGLGYADATSVVIFDRGPVLGDARSLIPAGGDPDAVAIRL